jgi:hypothetical protein
MATTRRGPSGRSRPPDEPDEAGQPGTATDPEPVDAAPAKMDAADPQLDEHPQDAEPLDTPARRRRFARGPEPAADDDAEIPTAEQGAVVAEPMDSDAVVAEPGEADREHVDEPRQPVAAGRPTRPRRQGPDLGRFWPFAAIAFLLAGIGAILIATAFDAPHTARRVGPNLPINPGARDSADISAHNSPTIARNPHNGDNLVATNRIDTPRFSCSFHTSFDGGGHWSQIPVPAPRERAKACYAPDVTFGPDGTLFLSYVTLKGRANSPSGTWLVTSPDGGQTLSTPRKVLGPLAFQVRLATDPARPNRVYMTWLQGSGLGLYRFERPGNPIYAIRSDDGGRTWSSRVRVSSAARGRAVAPAPAVGSAGELYVLYLDLGEDTLDYEGAHEGRGGPPYEGSWSLVLSRSRDRGATWSESVVEDRLVPTERFIAFTPPFPSLAVDRRDGRIYAAFQDGRLGDPDVNLWSLEKDASRWEGPKRVNDTPARDRTAQYLPKLAVAPNGRLDVAYYDRRADPHNLLNEVSLQSSYDQGETFGRRVAVSDRAFSSRIGYGAERRMPDLGSRLGLISTDEGAFASWADTRAGTRRTNKQDLGRAVISFSNPTRLADWLKYLLFVLGIGLLALGITTLILLRLGRLPGTRPGPGDRAA